jgi:hypothetical protein
VRRTPWCTRSHGSNEGLTGLYLQTRSAGDAMKLRSSLFLLSVALLVLPACHSQHLSSKQAAEFLTGQTFQYQAEDGYGSTQMSITSARCEGVSTEGQKATAKVIVVALPQASHDFPKGSPDARAVDPFTSGGTYIPLNTQFEFHVDATYTLYDTGWKLDTFTVGSGRHIGGSDWQNGSGYPTSLPPQRG